MSISMNTQDIYRAQIKALYYQRMMEPYADKAERDAREIMDSLDVEVPPVDVPIPRILRKLLSLSI